MGWFNNKLDINERITLDENTYRVWKFSLDRSKLISLFVQRHDGIGPSVYVIPDYEIQNYYGRLSFECMTDLTYHNIEYFSNDVVLGKGTYHLVMEVPLVQDGLNTYSEFSVRLKEVR